MFTCTFRHGGNARCKSRLLPVISIGNAGRLSEVQYSGVQFGADYWQTSELAGLLLQTSMPQTTSGASSGVERASMLLQDMWGVPQSTSKGRSKGAVHFFWAHSSSA